MAFSQSRKKETLEPFKDFPAFLVHGLAGCCRQRGSRLPYFVVFFPGRTWVYGVQRSGGFLLFVLVTLSSSKVGTWAIMAPRPPLWNLYAYSRYNM